MRPLTRRPTAADAAPRDPAPSRVAYRFQRLWLTPLFRSLLCTGIPVFFVTLGAGWYLSDQKTQDAIHQGIADIRRSIAERPEFMVQMLAIDGASAGLAEDIREILTLDFPVSSFDLEPTEIQALIAELDAVASVDVHIRPGGILQADVTERIPVVVWRIDDRLELLDSTGRRVEPLQTRSGRADLPLLAGEGADRAVPEALRLIGAAGPIADRLRGLVRVGDRRWDAVLDRDQRILLPETAPVAALEQVIALDTAQELLTRNLAVVDMRNPARPTVRLALEAVDELRRIRAIDVGD